MHYRTRDGDMLDALCQQHYGRAAGAVEAVLTANPGLANIGAILPAGIVIELPALPAPARTRHTVKLWD